MYEGKSFLAVIPARGGSKGIPHKNIVELMGKPLIQYTVEEAQKVNYIDELFVSTDDQKISEVVKELGVEVPFLRPQELADDEAKTIDTLLHVVKYYKMKNITFDYIILLQPTQPLRKSWHIEESIKKILSSNEEGLVSISKVSEHPLLIRTKDNNDRLKNILNIDSTVRRQDFPAYYKVNGAIYINKLNDNFGKQTSLNDNSLGYVMDAVYDLDIDSPQDLKLFEFMYEELKF